MRQRASKVLVLDFGPLESSSVIPKQKQKQQVSDLAATFNPSMHAANAVIPNACGGLFVRPWAMLGFRKRLLWRS